MKSCKEKSHFAEELLLFKNMVLGAGTKLFKALNDDSPLKMIEDVLRFVLQMDGEL